MFINVNNLRKNAVAEYLGVSSSFITQLCNGDRDVPADKIALIKANADWDSSMLDPMIKSDKSIGNIEKSTVIGANVSGNGNNITHNNISDMIELQKGFQELLKEKDKQIDRLLSIIEKCK